MKRLIFLATLSLSFCLNAEYRAPNQISLAKSLYYQGFYKDSLELFTLYYLRHDGSTPPIPGIDAYIGRMACLARMNREEEYIKCLDVLVDFLFKESFDESQDLMDVKTTVEFSEMFNESLFIELVRMTENNNYGMSPPEMIRGLK